MRRGRQHRVLVHLRQIVSMSSLAGLQLRGVVETCQQEASSIKTRERGLNSKVRERERRQADSDETLVGPPRDVQRADRGSRVGEEPAGVQLRTVHRELTQVSASFERENERIAEVKSEEARAWLLKDKGVRGEIRIKI